MSNTVEQGISILTGKVIEFVIGLEKDSEKVSFILTDGSKFIMQHHVICCEDVFVSDIVGDIDDILNTPILLAEDVISDKTRVTVGDLGDEKWTFYKINTIKGDITISWYGTSNGCYSIEVDTEYLPCDEH